MHGVVQPPDIGPPSDSSKRRRKVGKGDYILLAEEQLVIAALEVESVSAYDGQPSPDEFEQIVSQAVGVAKSSRASAFATTHLFGVPLKASISKAVIFDPPQVAPDGVLSMQLVPQSELDRFVRQKSSNRD